MRSFHPRLSFRPVLRVEISGRLKSKNLVRYSECMHDYATNILSQADFSSDLNFVKCQVIASARQKLSINEII